ncbi:carbamoyltransferase [Candidatus Latescibacterota bacterium]
MGPNTASCLLIDGQVVAFAEEERFIREKLATNRIPVRSSLYCLQKHGLTLADIDVITVGWDNTKYPVEMKAFYDTRMNHPLKDEYSKIYESISLSQKNPVYFTKQIQMSFRRTGYFGDLPEIIYYPHHLCHVYSVYYPSPFTEAIVLVMDGSGEDMATSIWTARGSDIECTDIYTLPDSLGYFYAALTEYLGFRVFTGEGKVMGLAPYGKHDPVLSKALDKILYIDGDGYKIDPEYIYFSERNYSFRHTDKLIELLGNKPRLPESEITDWQCNLAWEVQDKLEQVVKHLVRGAVSRYGIHNICLTGGVAMNCKMNGVVASMPEIDNCFVIPTSTDSGCAMGSAIYHARHEQDIREKAKQFSVYSGPSFTDEQILSVFGESKLTSYKKLGDKDLRDYVAGKLTEGSIVGWFQGQLEVGARALGNRSILADATNPDMKEKINREVKHREGFRPFAPLILDEFHHEIFDNVNNDDAINYYQWMLQAAEALPGVKEKIPAVVHVDNSIRPQLVSEATNAKMYFLLKAYYDKTGVPVLLNTSFNIRGEPIVCTPEDALRCFYTTGLDVLVINNFVIEK